MLVSQNPFLLTSKILVCNHLKQKQPATLDDAVIATLEMESYLLNVPKPSVSLVDHKEDNSTIGTVRTEDKLASLVERLVERVEQLESSDSAHSRTSRIPKDSPRSAGLKGTHSHVKGRTFKGECWKCGKRGHISRNCPTRAAESTSSKDEHTVLQVNPTSGFRLLGSINGASASFLIDTGASVTLVREDLWKRTQSAVHIQLTPWIGCRLKGVDGSPLHVLGQVAVELQFGKKHFPTDVVVAETLSAEAILGLDFLVQMHAVIDLAKQKIVLPDDGGELSLEKAGSPVTTPCFPVCIPEGIEVPPTS